MCIEEDQYGVEAMKGFGWGKDNDLTKYLGSSIEGNRSMLLIIIVLLS